MNPITYIFRFLYRIRYWLIGIPFVVTSLVIFFSGEKQLGRQYAVTTTIYTGIASGYGIDNASSGDGHDWNTINNAIDNIINIITSKTTLHRVSMRLFAQALVKGNARKDNTYITAASYRGLISRTPAEVLALTDTSEEITLANLYAYEKAVPGNHVYGLFNYSHPHYSYQALSQIKVKRLGNSDMLEITYLANDPGIAYNTLKILNEEFVKQYKELRFGETNNVIDYFRSELSRLEGDLHSAEENLTAYNVEKGIINYEEQTKHVAALGRDFELRYESILLENKNSEALKISLEERIKQHVETLKDNTYFVDKLKNISRLSAQISSMGNSQEDSTPHNQAQIRVWQAQLNTSEKDLQQITRNINLTSVSTDGVATTSIVSEWLDAVIRHEKSTAELAVMEGRKRRLDKEYAYYSPVGSILKRKERDISFTEQSYLSILKNLNDALTRQKSLEMSSATLKVINPPSYPLASIPTKRKNIVMGAFLGSIIFVLGFFLLLEWVDRTLRDGLRAEKITKTRVLGAFPAPLKRRRKRHTDESYKIAARQLCNALLGKITPGHTTIINIISTHPGTGKSFIIEHLISILDSMGLKARTLSYHRDFNSENKNVILATGIKDFGGTILHGVVDPLLDTTLSDKLFGIKPHREGKPDLVLVEYPNLKSYTISELLLKEADINLLVCDARAVWKETDQAFVDRLTEDGMGNKLYLCLNMTDIHAAESYTGQLPPYNYWTNWGYRLYEFGFTANK